MVAASSCKDSLENLTTEEWMVYQFRAYITPFIIVFGILGNILVLIAFSRMQHKSPCRFNLYVLAISVAHTVELVLNGLLDDFIGRGLRWLSDCAVNIKLDTRSTTACKIITFTSESAALVSTNLLAMFSVDRALTVYRPLQFRGDQHLKWAVRGVLVIYALGSTLHLPLAVMLGLVEKDGASSSKELTCAFLDSLHPASQYTLYLSTFGSNIVPAFVVLVCNSLIFMKLRELFGERHRLCSNDERNTSDLRRVIGHLSLTTVYFCLAVPLIVVILLRQQSDYQLPKGQRSAYAQKLVHLARLFSSVESIIYATGFPTYFAFLPGFRKELEAVFRVIKRKTSIPSGIPQGKHPGETEKMRVTLLSGQRSG